MGTPPETPPLTTGSSYLQPDLPVMVEAEERLIFSGASGNSLAAVLTTPATGSDAVVLLVHGGMANKNSFYTKPLVARLSQELGYCTFRFDMCGNGESGPITKPGTTEQARNMMSGFWDDVAELRAAVLYLQRERGLRVDCVVAHSRGAQVAHMLAARHGAELGLPRIAGANMRFDLEYWRSTWAKHVAEEGGWTLAFTNRGKKVEHNVSKARVRGGRPAPLICLSSQVPSAPGVIWLCSGEKLLEP